MSRKQSREELKGSKDDQIQFLQSKIKSLQDLVDLKNTKLQQIRKRDIKMSKLNDKHDEQMDKLEDEHEEQVKMMEERHEKEIEKLMERQELEIEELEEAQDREVETLEKKFDGIFSDNESSNEE
jgi:hypothetical protein